MTTLSIFWHRIERSLFPALEEDLGPLTATHKELAATLELVRVEEFVPAPLRGYPGRPPEDFRPIGRAFVAKALLNLGTTELLIETLNNDPNLRRLCGWKCRQDIPSAATFSRAFDSFAKTSLPEKVHTALIRQHEQPRLVGHISRDSTAIEAREKPAKKISTPAPAPRPPRRRGRPRKGETPVPREPTRIERQATSMDLATMLAELPTACDVGCKKNSQGFKETWRGFKLHLDWADSGIPVSCVLTSASVHDSQVAIPLAVMSAQRVTNLYDLMDSAYDAPAIKEVSTRLGHIPIIDPHPRRGQKKPPMEPARAQRYKERTTAERGNSQLKDNYGGRTVRVRGHAKVFAHMMFGVVALTAAQLLRLAM